MTPKPLRVPVDGPLRIAIVRLSSLGDVVHALPVAHALKVWFPASEVTWLVEKREQAILVGNPDIDHVVPVDTRLWRRELWQPWAASGVVGRLRGLVKRLAAGRFDIAIDLQGLVKSGIITWLTRAPVRLGLAASTCREPLNALFTTHRVRLPVEAVHVVEENLALLAGLGVARQRLGAPILPIASDAAAQATIAGYLEREGVKADTPLVAINPGSGGAAKRWPVHAYRRFADEITLRLGGRTLISWGPGEEGLARAIGDSMRTAPLVPPPTSIAELVAIVRRATLVVGGDTGPIHVAAALGVPTLGLYGPTQARRNGPYGARVATVQSPNGRMDAIAVEQALAAAEGLLR